jgi:hypothetical protein
MGLDDPISLELPEKVDTKQPAHKKRRKHHRLSTARREDAMANRQRSPGARGGDHGSE